MVKDEFSKALKIVAIPQKFGHIILPYYFVHGQTVYVGSGLCVLWLIGHCNNIVNELALIATATMI